MQFDAMKTLLGLVLVYGSYAGVYLASPAPLYAVTISLVMFLIFGTVVWYIGFQYGRFRAEGVESNRESRDRPHTDHGSLE